MSSTFFSESTGAALRLLDRGARKLVQHSVGLLALITVLSILRSLHLGQDANWDLRNYHFYNAFALVTGRFGLDLAPAMAQTYFNPALDLPFYGLVAAGLNPRVIAALMAMPYAAAAFFASKIAWQILNSLALSYKGIWWLLACLVNVGGAAGRYLLGTTTNDVYIAVLVLAAAWAMVRPQRAAARQRLAWRSFVFAGFLIGLAAGLKLTAAPYAVGLCVAIAVGQRDIRRAFAAMIACAAATVAGVALAAGPWMLFLYERFRSPLFPLFNAYFQSPFWERANLHVQSSGATSLWAALKLPYTLIHTTGGIEPSGPMRDWRLASLVGGLFLVVFTSVWRIGRHKTVLAAFSQPGYSLRALAQLLILFAVSYALWLGIFGIQASYRFLLPLEMATGTLLVGLLAVAVPNQKLLAAIALPVIFAILSTTRCVPWGRIPFGERFFEVQVPPIASGSLVLPLDRQPVGYLVPFFPDDARFVGPWWSGWFNYDFTNPAYQNLLQQQINAQIAQHRGAIYSIELARPAKGDDTYSAAAASLSEYRVQDDSAPGSAPATLSRYGLRHDSKGCQPIRSNMERTNPGGEPKRNLLLCSLERGS